MMALSMGGTNQVKRKTRRESCEPKPFEPEALRIPAPCADKARRDNRLVDDDVSGTHDDGTGTHVTVIDIS